MNHIYLTDLKSVSHTNIVTEYHRLAPFFIDSMLRIEFKFFLFTYKISNNPHPILKISFKMSSLLNSLFKSSFMGPAPSLERQTHALPLKLDLKLFFWIKLR